MVSGTTRPFIRQCALYVWPTQTPAATTSAMKFFGDGSLSSYYLRFRINRQLIGIPSESEIVLKNLKPATRAALATQQCAVRLDAGWADYGIQTIFMGNLLSAVSERQGPDITTTLKCMTGLPAFTESVVTQTYGAGTPVSVVVKDLAGKLPGVTIDQARISSVLASESIGFGGLSFACMTREALDRLANQYGFSWSVQDGVFQALTDGQSSSKPALLLSSKDGTLMNVVPVLYGPLQFVTGVRAKALLVPNVLPGDPVKIHSDILPPTLNDQTYTVHFATYQGSTAEDEWTMTLESVRPLPSNSLPVTSKEGVLG
jgi:hypothetical protein